MLLGTMKSEGERSAVVKVLVDGPIIIKKNSQEWAEVAIMKPVAMKLIEDDMLKIVRTAKSIGAAE